MTNLIWTIIVIMFVFWVLGFFVVHIGGLIHLLLVAAVVLFVINVLTRGRAAI